MPHPSSATIFALASAPGKAGVAVFRISGPGAQKIFKTLCRPAGLPAPREAALRKIVGEHETPIDQALALWFPAPASFTGEDVVELQLHGGRAVTTAALAALSSLEGFRLAEPGEFSRRAFENGKLDLTEAEAIADLVDAETSAQHRQALRQLDGELGRLYNGWANRLTHALAHHEAAIDFADEDLPEDLSEAKLDDIRALLREIRAHLDDHHRGERLREGFVVALLGAPNAGKSSLLNALAKREAAIVSATPGTTRDLIEIQLDLRGYPVTLVDTAGLRESQDAIESEGIRRALKRAEQADLKLLIFDGQFWPSRDLPTDALKDDNSILIVNKADLLPAMDETAFVTEEGAPLSLKRHSRGGGNPEVSPASADGNDLWIPASAGMTLGGDNGLDHLATMGEGLTRLPFLFVSATSGLGLQALTQRLIAEIDLRFASMGQPALTRARHRAALEDCREHLTRALAAPATELRAEDLRLAVRALGRITGTVDVEQLLDKIFREFCIGK